MALYHYCSNKAFLSIISQKKLRLTDLSHSNDLLEGRWVRDIILGICDENGVAPRDRAGILEKFDILSKIVTAGAFCLSGKPDLLSQWVSYADKAKGVSIGFNQEYLSSLIENQPLSESRLSLDKVIYDEKRQKVLIEPRVKEIIEYVNEGALRSGLFGLLKPSEDLLKKYDEANELLIGTVVGFIPFLYQIKNPAFIEEDEVRLVSIIRKSLTKESSVEKSHFVDRGNHIVTFLEVPLPDYGIPIIDEVILGPKNSSSEFTVNALLKKFEFDDVRVEKSKAPLR